jgi:hypothetical protein
MVLFVERLFSVLYLLIKAALMPELPPGWEERTIWQFVLCEEGTADRS